MNEPAKKMNSEEKKNDPHGEKVNEERKSKQAITLISIANAMMEFC